MPFHLTQLLKCNNCILDRSLLLPLFITHTEEHIRGKLFRLNLKTRTCQELGCWWSSIILLLFIHYGRALNSITAVFSREFRASPRGSGPPCVPPTPRTPLTPLGQDCSSPPGPSCSTYSEHRTHTLSLCEDKRHNYCHFMCQNCSDPLSPSQR